MSLTDNDRAVIREIAFEAGRVIAADLKEHFAKDIELHQAKCPVKIQVEARVNQAKGAKWVIGVVAAILGFVGGMAKDWILGK